MKKRNFVLTGIALGLSVLGTSLSAQAAIPNEIVEQGSLAPMLEKAQAAVVTLSVEGKAKANSRSALPDDIPEEFKFFFGDQFGEQFGGDRGASRNFRGLGSGVIINADKGYVLTNNHVVDGADKITVKLQDGREFKAKLVGKDEQSDIALVQIEKPTNLTAIKMADSDKLRVGDFTVAIGNPFGLGQTVTSGIVSALGRSTGSDSGAYENYIQTDAAVNRGNSGGALLNLQGELIGINTAIISPSGGNAGIAFAIPSNQANNLVQQILEFGEVRRGLLGIKGGELNADLAKVFNVSAQQGAFVSDGELNKIVDFIKKQSIPVEYSEEVTQQVLESDTKGSNAASENGNDLMSDELFEDAVRLVMDTGQASSSMLQRKFRIGYTRAARLVDCMEELGIVGQSVGSKPRELIMSRHEIEERFFTAQ